MRGNLYALAMPNNGPILTIAQALEYHRELMAIAREAGIAIKLLMTIYLSRDTTPQVIEEMRRMIDRGIDIVRAVKYYPPHKGATTGSGDGIPLESAEETLIAMEQNGIPFLGHCESVYDKNGRELPHAEREAYFVKNELWKMRDKHPGLKICGEHASTKEMVEWARADQSGNSSITVTPQHLLFIEPDFARFSWRNDLKCMPIVKTETDREALLEFVTSGDRRAILGTDTAPHPSKTKERPFEEAANGCWLPHALPMYVRAFEERGALDQRFVRFACLNGPAWWNLPLPAQGQVIHIRRETEEDIPLPLNIPESDDIVIPLGWSRESDRLQIGYALEHEH
jgi:dihydroorotase